MSRIDDVFEAASAAGHMTFMPFVTAGDACLETTRQVLLALRDAGTDLIELGFPYSDPIADGPVIQASYTRALAKHISVRQIMETMASLRDEGLPPVLAMVSFAIIFRHGAAEFVREAAEAGFSGLIVPDLPADEADDLRTLSATSGLDLVQLIAPTTSSRRTDQILATSQGFLYCISVAGTTGARRELPAELANQLRELRQRSRLPLAVGFGVSSPDQVAQLAGHADGVIVGSAIVKRIAESQSPEQAADAVREFCRPMMAATRAASPTAR
ncbi:MAG: tryptophan synthase subunit alpha [Planctomycetaceae bacterium]|nr:tryptophan synthase subunit alpha [Planctomycetaceae bacterium]